MVSDSRGTVSGVVRSTGDVAVYLERCHRACKRRVGEVLEGQEVAKYGREVVEGFGGGGR